MAKSTYLYIDDENDTSVESILNGFNDLNIINVERFPLAEFKEFGDLKKELVNRKEQGGFDGIIMDLRLDGDGIDSVEFSAISITSELRSIAARGDIIAFPIILCSTEEKIKETYKADKSSHDLFDYKFEKSISPNFERISVKLQSLSAGYRKLNDSKLSLNEIFGIDDLSELDNRIFERFDDKDNIRAYDYAHFIVKAFFHCTNPLVKERTLAARLGVDIEQSQDWQTLIDKYFIDAKYKGIFSSGWSRWWAHSIIAIFKKISDKKLPFLSAEERVGILKGATGFSNLVPAEPINLCKSTEFWTICEAYKRPLDPLEGFKIQTSHELKPWQENKYLSLDAIVERVGIERGLKPHASELNRIEEIKKTLQNGS